MANKKNRHPRSASLPTTTERGHFERGGHSFQADNHEPMIPQVPLAGHAESVDEPMTAHRREELRARAYWQRVYGVDAEAASRGGVAFVSPEVG